MFKSTSWNLTQNLLQKCFQIFKNRKFLDNKKTYNGGVKQKIRRPPKNICTFEMQPDTGKPFKVVET